MPTFHSFEEIDAWQESRVLVRCIRKICKRVRVSKDFAFIDQITRAARSVSANIAEGNDSLGNKEFIRFLGYSKRSCAEVRSHLFDALDEEYVSQVEFEKLCDLTRKICSMLAKLIHHLQNSPTRKSCSDKLRTIKRAN